ncbi:MAG TPA: (d)CMP kinase [Desulfobacteraceae bacterium]|nr:(d)CMP kinase [Desulfobacteraceae bacterium]
MTYRIVTIDGPAGAGKTTVSKQLAATLGCVYVDTGALYRGVAYEIDRQKIDWQDEAELNRFLESLDLGFKMTGQDLALVSSGKDITSFIRTPEITMLASATSALPAVRQALLGIQKHIAATRDAVFEGRDMGTAVFPDAPFKFFLFADLGVRARRRHDELGTNDAELEKVQAQMAKRDKDDESRKTNPLKPAPDAVSIDSTHMTVDQVVTKMQDIIEKA